MLALATAYIILRPFFSLRPELSSRANNATYIPLDADAWVLNLDDPAFPGCVPGKTQAIRPGTHPHLRIDRTIVSIPRVEPGDQVYCECIGSHACHFYVVCQRTEAVLLGHTDVVHAVEAEHNGTEESSVLYIPAVPLTEWK